LAENEAGGATRLNGEADFTAMDPHDIEDETGARMESEAGTAHEKTGSGY
jgi:hypothetical protein